MSDKSYFDKLVDRVTEWSKPSTVKSTKPLVSETPMEYFEKLDKEKEFKAIKDTEKNKSVSNGKKVDDGINKVIDTPKPITESKSSDTVKNNTTSDSVKKVDKETKGTKKENKSNALTTEVNDNIFNEQMKYISNADNKKKAIERRLKEVSDESISGTTEREVKDNVARLKKYLGGGALGGIADIIGIYGDMSSTSKHNLAQAYFQAAGKGGQYKDPLAKEILSKKIGTMIDSVASAIKENNTESAKRGYGILDYTLEEGKKIYGNAFNTVATWVGYETNKTEALIMKQFADDLAYDERFVNDNVYRNGLLKAMKNPEDRAIVASLYHQDQEIAENYILMNYYLGNSEVVKSMTASDIAKDTKDSQIFKTNMDNTAQGIYNNLKIKNMDKMFDIEFQTECKRLQMLTANASDAQIQNEINKSTQKLKVFGFAEEVIAKGLKDVLSVPSTIVGLAK